MYFMANLILFLFHDQNYHTIIFIELQQIFNVSITLLHWSLYFFQLKLDIQ